MNRIIVETQVLLDTANKIEMACDDYESTVATLYQNVDDLCESWIGSDNVAFSNQILSYRKDFNRIALLIREYVEYLRNSAQAYENTQQELANAAGRLRSDGTN